MMEERWGPVTFVGATDAEAAREFYGGVLGFRLVEEEPQALVFDAHGTVLRVTLVSELVPAPFTILGWSVPDLTLSVRMLSARGVRFEQFEGFDQDELGIFVFPNGDRVAWFRDPAGNLLSLTQFQTGD